MKIYVLPADAYGCGHYRLVWPAQILQRQGFDITIVPPNKDTGFMAKTAQDSQGNTHLTSIGVPQDADVIVLQRPGHPLQPQMVQLLRANKIAVVIDMDDDMSSIHPDNAAFHLYRPSSSSALSWKNASEACKHATVVTTSTKILQRVYAKHGRGVVLDNYVPASYLRFPQPETGCIGWAGTTKSHPNDLQVTGRAVQQLRDEGHCVTIVGGDAGVPRALKLTSEVPMTGMVPLNKWAQTIAETMDVGMIPLAATSFNASKSRLKGIECSAVGVPWVASPREEYRRLVKESGAGLLAETPRQWHDQLKELATNEQLRKELKEAGTTYMENQTYEAQAWRWAEVWTKAYETERG
jgi:hypothetical protein